MSLRNEGSEVPVKAIHNLRAMLTQSIEVEDPSRQPNESKFRRSPSSGGLSYKDMYAKYYGGSDGTMVVRLQRSAKTFGTRTGMKWRPIAKLEKTEIEENGKKKPWEFIHLQPTKSMTYTELWERIVKFGSGFVAATGLKAGAKVGLYEETRAEWMISCYGLWTQGMVPVTVYANLGEDALLYAVKEAELDAIVCSGKAVKGFLELCKKAGVNAPKVIYTDTLPSGFEAPDVFSWTAVTEAGAFAEPTLPTDPEQLALIMYTSGTTGDPKGVMLTHGNVYAAVEMLGVRLETYLGKPADAVDETYIAYLPLAHIMEFVAENIFLVRGSTLCYGNPRTLTNTSARPHGDLQEFKPVVLIGVPRIFDTIKKAVEAKLPVDGLKRRVFDRAMQERKGALARGVDTPYWNEKVFKGPRELLGGRIKAVLSGGAPLSKETQEFMLCLFGCPVLQGYGLTETSACCTVARCFDTTLESIGPLVSGTEVKLKDTENWKHTDASPQGEICIRGPQVTKGYFKQPGKTAEVLLADGWFHTGDVGRVAPDGTLRIVGRVKALAKNALGEYVALESLEATYAGNALVVPNGICVLVHPHRAYIAAVALTDEAKCRKFLEANPTIKGEWPSVVSTEEFRKKAIESLAATAKGAGKKPFEFIKEIRFYAEEWTPENGILTAASKLKRREIDAKYADDIKQMFLKD